MGASAAKDMIESPRAAPPAEPRRMTLADLGVLVAACALALSVPLRMSLWPPNIPAPAFVLLLILSLRLAEEFGLTLAVTVLYRRARFGGTVRPAERLALALGAFGLLRVVPNLDDAVNGYYAAVGAASFDFGLARRALAAPATLGLAATVGLLVPLRRRARAGSRVAAALGVIGEVLALFLWFWGPAVVARLELPGIVVPSPSGDPATWGRLKLVVWVARDLVELAVESIPWGLLAAATLRAWIEDGRSGRPWLWTEWAALADAGAAAALILAAIGLHGPGESIAPMLGIAGVGLASWWITGRLALYGRAGARDASSL